MTKKLKQITATALLTLIVLPITANANIIWPAVYVSNRLYSWYIILAGLVIEILFIRFAVKQPWKKSALISVVMNAISAIIGIFALPFVGLAVEFALSPVSDNTFSPLHWTIAYIVGLAFNVLIEGSANKLIFHLPFKKNVIWLTVANAISVIICVISMAVSKPFY